MPLLKLGVFVSQVIGNVWMDRAATALVTLLLGASAQGLLSWREIGVLSTTVARIEAQDREEHRRFVDALQSISDRQQENMQLQAALVERLQATREALEDHRHGEHQ